MYRDMYKYGKGSWVTFHISVSHLAEATKPIASDAPSLSFDALGNVPTDKLPCPSKNVVLPLHFVFQLVVKDFTLLH